MRKKSLPAYGILIGGLILSSVFIIYFYLGILQQLEPVLAEKVELVATMRRTLFDSPYYITCDADIVGPTIDLAAIQLVTGGTIYDDHVEWEIGVTPGTSIARVYIDNTLQVIVHGTLEDVSRWIEEDKLRSTCVQEFNDLVNQGGIDPSSTLSEISYKTRLLSGYPKVWKWSLVKGVNEFTYSVSSNIFLFIRFSIDLVSSSVTSAKLYLNGELYHDFGSIYNKYLSTIISNLPDTPTIVIRLYVDCSYHSTTQDVYVNLFTGDDSLYITYTPILEYFISNSPGTGLALKEVSPETSNPNQDIDVTVLIDPPIAEKINMTESFPIGFTFANPVTLTKYGADDTIINSATINVTPEVDGMLWKFTINYDDAIDVLGRLEAKQWLTMEYELKTPSTTGIKTLPATEIEYRPMFD